MPAASPIPRVLSIASSLEGHRLEADLDEDALFVQQQTHPRAFVVFGQPFAQHMSNEGVDRSPLGSGALPQPPMESLVDSSDELAHEPS
jgi:hypothetical protein